MRDTMKRVRILVQQKETGLYLKNLDSWDRHGSEAKDFMTSTNAINFCVANKLSGVNVVLKFEEEPYEFVWPVLAARESRPMRSRASA
jgi:hypothetical protein